jgi:uncharacterized protein (TIGR02611 family)
VRQLLPPQDATATSLSAWRWVRKAVVLVIGGTVVLIGVAMIVLPGPAVVVIPAGLGILATEFVWARRLLHHAKRHVERAAQRVKNGRGQRGDPPTVP